MDRRCLIITYYFPPLGGGGVQRIAKLVKYASRQGWQFTVITAQEQTAIIPQDPTLQAEIPSKTNIIRVPFKLLSSPVPVEHRITQKSNYWKRWLSAFFYLPDSRKKWLGRAWPSIENELQNETYDLVLISIPPYSLSFLAKRIKARFGMPVVLDMRDPWTLNPYKIYPTPLHRRIDWQMEKKVIASAEYGISAYKKPLEFYENKIENFNSANWTVIPNGFDEEDFADLKPKASDHQTFNLAFSGTIYSHINHPAPLFKAMAQLKQRFPELGAKARFLFVGKAHIDLRKATKKYGLEKQIVEKGYLPHQQSVRLLNEADALCFILDDRRRESQYTVGGKVYEYLRLKKPILALVPQSGEAAELIRETHSGVVVPPRQTGKIVRILHDWMQALPQFEFRHIERFSRKKQAQEWMRFLEKIALSS